MTYENMKTFARTALVVLFCLVLAVPVFSQAEHGEAGAEHGEAAHGEPGLFSGDLGNAIWTIVIFLGLFFVLSKFAWGPILNSLQQREEFIRSSLEEAKRDREAAEARLKEYEERLKEARAEATGIVEEGRRDAEVLRGRIEQEAREEGEKIRRRTLKDLDIAKETAVKELYELSGKLATQIASQVIGRELKAEDHQKLIESAIAEMEDLETN